MKKEEPQVNSFAEANMVLKFAQYQLGAKSFKELGQLCDEIMSALRFMKVEW